MSIVVAIAAFAGATVASGDDPAPLAPLSEGPPRPVGEVEEDRTATSRTLELSDGSFRTQEFLSAINFRDGGGDWTPIDNRLVHDRDGFTTRANDVAVRIPSNLGDGPVGVETGDHSVGFELQGAAAVADVDGATATFEDALPHVSVSYEAVGRMVKETLTLASSDAPDTYDFDLSSSPGLTPRLEDSGAVEFVDAHGRRRFRIAAPWMRDAAGTYSADARYRLVEESGKRVLRLKVSRTWLDSPDRQYPVDVDPTTTPVANTAVCQLEDGHMSNISDCAAGSNIIVGRDLGGHAHRTIANFSLAQIPAHALVREANLVTTFHDREDSAAKQAELLPLDRVWTDYASWNEARPGVPWDGGLSTTVSQRPAPEGRATLTTIGQQVRFPMTRLAQAWKDGDETRYGVLLKTTDETHDTLSTLSTPYMEVDWYFRTGRSRNYTYEQIGAARDTSVAVNVGNGNLALASFDFSFPANGSAIQANRLYNSRDSHINRQFGIDGRASGPLNVALQRFPRSGDYYFDGPNGIAGVYHRNLDYDPATDDPSDQYRSPSTYSNTTLTTNGAGGAAIQFEDDAGDPADTGERWEFGNEVAYGPVFVSTVTRIQRRNDTATSALFHTNRTVDATDGTVSASTLYPAGSPASLRFDFGTDANVDTARTDTGQTITYTYDPTTHRLTQARQSSTIWATYGYDGAGRIDAITTNLGKTTLVYDVYDRVTSATYDPAGTPVAETTTFGYVNPTAPCNSGHLWKTVVTPPEGSIREYCPDTKLYMTDVWNPVPKPRGAWYDLRDSYVNGRGTHSISLGAEDQGTGITRVGLEELKPDRTTVLAERAAFRSGCAQRDTFAAPTVLNDPLCPNDYSAAATVDARLPLTEGAHHYRLSAKDRALPTPRLAYSPVWTVYVDRTPPRQPTNLRADYDVESGSADIEWLATDPALADGSPGSGVKTFTYRYRRAGGDWSAWRETAEPGFTFESAIVGESVGVEVRATDGAGNDSAVTAGTVVVGSLSDCEIDLNRGSNVINATKHVGPAGQSQQIDAFTFTQPKRANEVTAALPSGTRLAGMIEQTATGSDNVATSGLTMSYEGGIDRTLGLWNDFIRDDMADFADYLRSARATANDTDRPIIDRQLADLGRRQQIYDAYGGLPIKSVAIVHDPAVAYELSSTWAGQLESGSTTAQGSADGEGCTAPTTASPTAAAPELEPEPEPVRAAGDGGADGPDETGVRKGSYSPRRIRVATYTKVYRHDEDDNKNVAYNKVVAAYRFPSSSNRSYWFRGYRRNDMPRGYEVQVDMDQGDTTGGSFGYPPWGFLPAPDNSNNFEGIRGIWSANFRCAYPDDYTNDDVHGKYSLTVGSGCRPLSNRFRYRWAHIVYPLDNADYVRPSITPVHYAQPSHKINPAVGSEATYCSNQEKKRGSCYFSDHGVAPAKYTRSDGLGPTLLTPGQTLFERQ
ncbi:MAG TPA: DNRLRE domain-containing protein [Solirubrobacteraceae bacterium]